MPTQTQAQAYWLLLESFHTLLTLDDRLYLESLAEVRDWTPEIAARVDTMWERGMAQPAGACG